ncbi:MAG: tetratricopeptide repeat protein [Deltaproteobacteria bacterium]|nr:tetratricopeptide repeat protein [Deltaproteobacteria bacterium]
MSSLSIDAHAQQDRRTRAVRLFEESEIAFAEHRYPTAVALLREAHALEPEPILLYNLARAYEELGDDVHALEALDGYLATDLDAPSRTEALARRDRIAARIALRPPPPPIEEPSPSRTGPPESLEPIAIGVVLSGGVLVLAAVGLAIASELEHARAEDAETSLFAARDALRARDALAIARDVLGVTGGLACAVGGVWWLVLPRADGVSTGAWIRAGGTF